jgi:hypothetical protein
MSRRKRKDRLVALHAVERMANRRLDNWEEEMLHALWDDLESK